MSYGSRPGRWRRRARRLVGRLLPPRPGAVILGYHRIADPDTAAGADPRAMCVSPACFEEQMAELRRLGRPVSLSHLLRTLDAGESVRGMIAVTFDDGYDDVLRVALPVLERERVPATVFLVAGAAGRVFWWDRLDPIVSAADASRPFRIRAGASELVWPGTGEGEQLKVHLHRALRTLEEEERTQVLQRLAEVLSVDGDRARPEPPAGRHALPRALTVEEARRLVASRWVEAGSHSVSHPSLAELPPRRAREEIVAAKAAIEAALDREITAFSYPHGSSNAHVRRLVREAGHELACVSRPDSVRSGGDRYALPRVWVRNHSGRHFGRALRRYVGSSAGVSRREET